MIDKLLDRPQISPPCGWRG